MRAMLQHGPHASQAIDSATYTTLVGPSVLRQGVGVYTL